MINDLFPDNILKVRKANETDTSSYYITLTYDDRYETLLLVLTKFVTVDDKTLKYAKIFTMNSDYKDWVIVRDTTEE